MTYKLNNSEVCPSEGQYSPREPFSVTGDGHPLYPSVRSFEMRWEFTTYEEWAAAQVAFQAHEASGMASVTIPRYPTATGTSYGFYTYTGVAIHEPILEGPFFAEHPAGMLVVISNIPVA